MNAVTFDPSVAQQATVGRPRLLGLSNLVRKDLSEWLHGKRPWVVLGVTTNTAFLRRLITHPEVVAVLTGFRTMGAFCSRAVTTPTRAAVRSASGGDPATAGRDQVALPYRVDAYWTERT